MKALVSVILNKGTFKVDKLFYYRKNGEGKNEVSIFHNAFEENLFTHFCSQLYQANLTLRLDYRWRECNTHRTCNSFVPPRH